MGKPVLDLFNRNLFLCQETLELLAAYVHFNEFLPRLYFACLQYCLYLWNCSTCIYGEYGKCHRLFETLFVFILGECHTLSPCVDCNTFPPTLVLLILCDCHTNLLLLLVKSTLLLVSFQIKYYVYQLKPPWFTLRGL